MDKSEARKVLEEQLAQFAGRTHSELVPLVEARSIETCEVRGESGATYQIEFQFFWDDHACDTIRVMGSIDDGGLRAFFPLTDSLLIPRPKEVQNA